jgi:hypothetical protein
MLVDLLWEVCMNTYFYLAATMFAMIATGMLAVSIIKRRRLLRRFEALTMIKYALGSRDIQNLQKIEADGVTFDFGRGGSIQLRPANEAERALHNARHIAFIQVILPAAAASAIVMIGRSLSLVDAELITGEVSSIRAPGEERMLDLESAVASRAASLISRVQSL